MSINYWFAINLIVKKRCGIGFSESMKNRGARKTYAEDSCNVVRLLIWNVVNALVYLWIPVEFKIKKRSSFFTIFLLH